VAHSMGGLVTRSYVQGSLYQDDVDQVIFIATPHRGSPKAYFAWEGGSPGVNIRADIVKELIVKQIASISGYEGIFNYIRDYPVYGVQELLPDYSYLISKDEDMIILYSFDSSEYPQNQFLYDLNLASNRDKFTERVREATIIYNQDSLNTPESISVVDPENSDYPLWEHGKPDGFTAFNRRNGINFGSGDTTVPLYSSTDFNADRLIEKFGVGHNDIVSYSSSDVIDILQGEYIPITVIDEPDGYIIIQVYSPVDLFVTLPNGKTVGINPLTGTEVNEVDGAYYSGFGSEVEFIVLPGPLGGEYSLAAVGTGEGEFTIEVSSISNTGMYTSSLGGSVAEGQEHNYTFKVADGLVEEFLSTDQALPDIVVNSPEARQYIHSDIILVDYSVTDEESGVATSSISVDSVQYIFSDIDLFEYDLGMHDLTVYAADRVGNRGEMTVNFEVIATFESMRSDILRLYSEGDIIQKFIKKQLLHMVDVLEQWYNQLTIFESYTNRKSAHMLIENIQTKWLPRVVLLYLYQMEQQGWITQKASNMLNQQFTYIANNL